MMDTIDIVITSTSRPALLQRTVKSMQEKLKFSGKFRWLLHEDCLNLNKSAETLHWAKYSNMFDKIIMSNPRRGLGLSIYDMFQHIESMFFFRSDDDWEYVKAIDVDKIFNLFIKHKDINQVILNKNSIDEYKREFKRVDFLFDDVQLTLCNQWGWIPAFWRKSFVVNKYEPSGYGNNISFLDELKNGIIRDEQWYRCNMGAYFLGAIGSEGKEIKHIGGDSRSLNNGGTFGIY